MRCFYEDTYLVYWSDEVFVGLGSLVIVPSLCAIQLQWLPSLSVRGLMSGTFQFD